MQPPASMARRVLLLVTAGFHVFFTAGVVFGWASLADALAADGALCYNEHCTGQAAAFALIFTLGTIGNYTSNLPFGLVLDRFGPQICCICGALVQTSGGLLMLARGALGDEVLYPGFFLLGFGGPGIQIATFHLANLFPEVSGSLIAGSTALFDAGTAVFFAFSLASASGVASLATCWAVYVGGCLLVLVSGALLWPPLPYAAEAGPQATPGSSVNSQDLWDSATPRPLPQSAPLKAMLTSRPFIYLVLFACVHILRLNFVVGTFQQQAAALGFDAPSVLKYTNLFASLLPFGFVGMPLIGFLLDRRPLSHVFALVNLTGLACTALLMVPASPAAFVGAIALVAVGRQFVYSTFFAQLQRTAGPNYGTLAGIANLCVAAAGAAQPALVQASMGTQHFVPTNGLFLLLVVALLSQPLPFWEAPPAEQRDEKSAALLAAVHPEPPAGERGAPLSTLRVALIEKS